MMYTHYACTLRTLISLPTKVQRIVLRNIDGDFIRFLVECIVNLVHGNFSAAMKKRFRQHRSILESLTKKKNVTRNQQRTLVTSERGLRLLKALTPLIYEKFAPPNSRSDVRKKKK